jgi:hypothetical protein
MTTNMGTNTNTNDAGLPTVAPLWAEALGETQSPVTAQQFFGDPPAIGPSAHVSTVEPIVTPTVARSDPMVGSDRLLMLGPLIVDDYDLAPDLIRMYTELRNS